MSALADGFRRQVAERPEATALVWQDEEISYRDLAALVDRARRRLAALEQADDEPIGLLVTKSPAAIAMILACVVTGRRFLLPSPALAPKLLAELFAQAGCRNVLSVGETPSEPESAVPAPEVTRPVDDPSFLLTTSGSTGIPKIVPIPYGAVDRFAAWASAEFGIGPGVSVLNYAPLNFDLCLLDIWTTLAYGGRVVLVDTAHAVNPRHLAQLLKAHEVHVVQAVPMFFGLLQDAARDATFPAVREVMATGDVIGEQTLAGLPALFPNARLSNIYGCTETNDSFRATMHPGEHPVPLGEPLPGVATKILDDDGVPLTGAGTGELYVRTPFQTAGYLDPTRNEGKFADGWFRTGDLVRVTGDGRILLIGRSDFQVKVRGVAVNTAEVENALLAHPEVLEAAVAARPDPLLGRRLVAAVQRAPGSRLNTLTLREHCARRLPQAAVPATLRIADEPLPKTATGKVDRNAVGREDLLTEGRAS